MSAEKIVRIIIIVLLVAACCVIAGSIFICASAPHLARFSTEVKEHRVETGLQTLTGSVFVTGMKACENLYLEKHTRRVYVTDLTGHIHLIDGGNGPGMSIVKSRKIGTMVLGIDKGPDGYLYLGVGTHKGDEWMAKGGSVYRIDRDLVTLVRVTGDYPSLNGLAFDAAGTCYFASSNFDFLKPKGHVYSMKVKGTDAFHPKVYLDDAGLANGIYCDHRTGMMYLSTTIMGIYTFAPGSKEMKPLYFKTRLFEAVDDLCTDRRGRIWMTDPGDGFLKMYDVPSKTIVRYKISGIGQTSSCRIRDEHGAEIIYVTELKQTRNAMSKVFDGRGLVIIPLESLVKAASKGAWHLK